MLLKKKKAERLAKLITCVTGLAVDDLLPLTEENEAKIFSLIKDLGSGKSSGREHFEVLSLSFGLGDNEKPLSYAKIGKQFAVSGGAIRNQIGHAINMLRHPARNTLFMRLHRSYLEKRLDELEKENQTLRDLKTNVTLALKEEAVGKYPDPKIMNRSVDDFEFSVRTTNCLRHAGIKTVRDLVSKTDAELLKIKPFGRKSLNEVRKALDEVGLAPGMKVN